MPEKVTVELPQDLLRQVQMVARHTQRSFDDVLVEWIRQAGSEPVLELLSDEELLAVCDNQWNESLQEILTELLEKNQEGTLDSEGRHQLETLMGTYRRDLVRKAQALNLAVTRSLRPRLN